MKYTICFICLIASLLFSACGTDYKKIDAVTGLHLYDANGSAVGLWNSPNDNMDPSTLIFPNPNNGFVFLGSTNTITNAWLLIGDCGASNDTSIREEARSLSFTKQEVENAAVRDFSIDNFNNDLAFNFQDLPAGFYRLFYELSDGNIHWQNIYIDPAAINFVDFSFLDDACN